MCAWNDPRATDKCQSGEKEPSWCFSPWLYSAEYCTLEIIDLSTELTYSLVTVRAVVDVFESQFKHLQLL